MSETTPYAALADGYDAVMEHVDYDAWADHAAHLLQTYAPRARDLVELGCGTGELALELLERAPEDLSYRGYDGSPEMVAIAQKKAADEGAALAFGVLRFDEPVPGPPAEAVLLLYDGLNYILDADDVTALLRAAFDALRPDGVFVFDQSTPTNSQRHAADFEDAGSTEAFDYVRSSQYDPAARLHTTRFALTFADGSTAQETHVQRAYSLDEVRAAVGETDFQIEAVLDGFSDDPATDATERAHWVLRRPAGAA